MDGAIVAARIAQYLGAATLFGAPLFLLYAWPAAGSGSMLRWPRPVAIGAALAILLGAAAYLPLQTAMMAGDPAAATDPEMLRSVLLEMALGIAVLARTVAAVVAIAAALVLRPGRPLWALLAALGAVALASFPWTGHGAAGEGAAGLVQLVADIIHLLAAGAWIGALVAFALIAARPAPDALPPLHRALAGFSGVGSLLVAAIVASGLVNGWFLVGLPGLPRLLTTPYGTVLLVKLAAFAAMAGLAARNRWVHTPALEQSLTGGGAAEVRGLRASVFSEAALGGIVLGLVGILGTLAPISSD